MDSDAVMAVKGAFLHSDVTKDGVIDKQELKKVMSCLDPTLGDDALDEMFQAVDKDGSGTIDVQEWLAWIFGGGEVADAVLSWALNLGKGDAVLFKGTVVRTTTTETLVRGPDGSETWHEAEFVLNKGEEKVKEGDIVQVTGEIVSRTTADLKIKTQSGALMTVDVEDVAEVGKPPAHPRFAGDYRMEFRETDSGAKITEMLHLRIDGTCAWAEIETSEAGIREQECKSGTWTVSDSDLVLAWDGGSEERLSYADLESKKL